MLKKTSNLKPSVHGTYISDIKNNFDKKFFDQVVEVLQTDKYFNNYSDVSLKKEIISSFKNINLQNFIQINESTKSAKFNLTFQEISWLKKRSKKIWGKYLIYRYKFKVLPQKYIAGDFPPYVLIEPTSICNLRCIMCFQIDTSFTSDKEMMGKMDLELFKNIIDEAHKNGTKAITLASRGEPTLHPDLPKMLEYCSGKFFELKINTNATRLNEELIHDILKSGVTDVVFSVDSYQKQDYEKIRVRGIFETVVENIKKFKEIKDEYYPNSICATRISGVRVDKQFDSVKFKEFWEKYVDHVVVVEMENRWDTYHNSLDIGAEEPCEYLWERMYLWFDGICNPCDADYKSELALGNVKNTPIKEIWHGEKYTNLRNLHLEKKRRNCYPCDRCPIGS